MFEVLFFAAFAAGLEWWRPDPTFAAENTFALDGWTPKPTGFMEMAKRQQIPDDDTICGYISGDPDGAINCSGAPCGYNTLYSWFGCCATATFSGTNLIPLGCPVVTACVPYTLLEQCNAACASNTLIMKCTDTASPYCGYGDLVEDQGMTAVGCAQTPFTVPVALSTTGAEVVTPTTTVNAAGTTSVNEIGTSSTSPIVFITSTTSPTVVTQPVSTTTLSPSPIHVGAASKNSWTWIGEFFTSLVIMLNSM